MEMCVDNPREEFADLFATHPSIEQRVAAIIKFAGGHDPGPLALPGPDEPTPSATADASAGPWGSAPATTGGGAAMAKPFLPGPAPTGPADGNTAGDEPGPWGPHRGS